MTEKITKIRMSQPKALTPIEMVKFRTFQIMKTAAIAEINRLMREFGITEKEIK